MTLSIVTPVYTAESYVASCLESCLSQNISEMDYEIIVINDGSVDMSQSIMDSYEKQHNNIHLITQSHKGPGGARNAGMRVAKGDYYMFLDADDRIRPNCLKDLIAELEQNSPDCLAFCAANMVGDKPIRRFSYEGVSSMSGIDLLKRGVEPCATFTLWKASFLRENDLWFEEGILHEDCEFTPRAYYKAKKIYFTDEVVYWVYPNPNSITRSVNPRKSFDLLNVVCTSLYEFKQKVSDENKYIFDNLIALYINNAMANILLSNDFHKKRFNEALLEAKYLWQTLRHSTVLKYRLEGLLFHLFKHPLYTYKFLQMFNFRRWLKF